MNKLTDEEKRVIIDKGTEAPFSGKLIHPDKDGFYKCAACGNPSAPMTGGGLATVCQGLCAVAGAAKKPRARATATPWAFETALKT